MRRSRSLVVLVLSALMLCAVAASPLAAPAARGEAVSGTISVVGITTLSDTDSGGNNVLRAVADVALDGDLVGPAVEHFTSITHGNGATTQYGTGVFTGTLDDREGTIIYVFHGNATEGVISIQRGTGELAGVHGKINYSFNADTGVFDYTGRIWFT